MLYDPLESVHKQKKLAKNNIAGMYAKSNIDLGRIQKSEENDIEKGGEGSRGGKIIGHTKSGKPVYDSFDHSSHEKFTAQDHKDAVEHHVEAAKKDLFSDDLEHATKHKNAAKEKDSKEHTETLGKTVMALSKMSDKESTEFEKTHGKGIIYKQGKDWKISNEKIKSLSKDELNDLHDKIKGDDGSKVIGKTKSGKNIKDFPDHPDHKDFDAEDHLDAFNAQKEISDKRKKEVFDKHDGSTKESREDLDKDVHHGLASERMQKHLDHYGKLKGIIKKSDIIDVLEKGEISDCIASGYGAGSQPVTFEKTGKEIKDKIPEIKNSLSASIASIEGQLGALLVQIGKEPENVSSRKYDKTPPYKRYDYTLCEPVYCNGQYAEKTEENTLCNKYNTLVYLWQDIKDDYDSICVMENNLTDTKKYTLSVSQLIALNFK